MNTIKTKSKTKQKTNWQQSNMLQDVITEFSESPRTRRSVNNESSCLYNPPVNKSKSKGCAIGMYLSSEVAKELDLSTEQGIYWIMSNKKLKTLLPDWMQKMNKRYLADIQSLHDGSEFRNTNNISKAGKECIRAICDKYKLPFDRLIFK